MSAWPKEKLYSTGSIAGLPSTSATIASRKRKSDGSAKDTYRVVFWGKCARGFDRANVAQAFARRFKITTERQLDGLFSGKMVTLKRGLSDTQATRYTDAIEALGGICRKESEQNDYFSETEFMTRNTVSFLEEDFDPSSLSLAPKDEFSTER